MGLCLTVIGILLIVCLGMILSNKRETKYARQFYAMDTIMNIEIYDTSVGHAKDMLELSENEINRLDQLLSTGNSESEVSRLNQDKRLFLSWDCQKLLERSLEIFQLTNGCFDITIYPIMKEWGFTDSNYHIPDEAVLHKLTEKVDSSKIRYFSDTGEIILPDGVMIDFGGIAKGYASNSLVSFLKENGVEHALLDLGGNVHALGTKPDGSNWKVAVRFPDNSDEHRNDYLGVLSIADQAVVTSGGYERFFENNGTTYHHIIDPDTGKPVNHGLLSVTIVDSDATLADGLSTALYVAGLDKAITIWRESKENFDIVFYTENDKLYITEGIQDSFRTELDVEVIYR